MTLALMVTGYVVARRRGYGVEVFPGWRAVALRIVSALPGLGLVALIFVGIRAGIFTAVESAAIAVVYALLVTTVLYRQLRWREFFDTVIHAARSTGVILFVIATAAVFGWLLAYLQVPAAAVEFLQSFAHSRFMVLLMIVVMLLLLGTFMDLAPMILICTPIFLPVARAYGIDPIHFGLVLVLTGGLGLVTPPVGSVLFIGTSIGKISVGQSMRTIWPFWFAALGVLLVVTFFPALSLWLPAALRLSRKETAMRALRIVAAATLFAVLLPAWPAPAAETARAPAQWARGWNTSARRTVAMARSSIRCWPATIRIPRCSRTETITTSRCRRSTPIPACRSGTRATW